MIRTVIVLSPDFSFKDLNNLRERYQLHCPIVVADKVLADKWNSLNEEFFPGELNNIMALISHDGRILSNADAECACYAELFLMANEIKGRQT